MKYITNHEATTILRNHNLVLYMDLRRVPVKESQVSNAFLQV